MWNAFEEPFEVEIRRLMPIDDSLHNIARQEGETQNPGNVSFRQTFLLGQDADRRRLT
jgi:hypothetical protein